MDLQFNNWFDWNFSDKILSSLSSFQHPFSTSLQHLVLRQLFVPENTERIFCDRMFLLIFCKCPKHLNFSIVDLKTFEALLGQQVLHRPEIKLDGKTDESMDDEDGGILNDENDGALNQIIECFNEMDIKGNRRCWMPSHWFSLSLFQMSHSWSCLFIIFDRTWAA